LRARGSKPACRAGQRLDECHDGFWRPDVRLPFMTDHGETVSARYTGLVETDRQVQASDGNESAGRSGSVIHVMNFDMMPRGTAA